MKVRNINKITAYLSLILFFGALFFSLYLEGVWDLSFSETELNKEVEPEYFSGLLTSSSILLSFSLWVVGTSKKNKEVYTLLLLVLPMFLLMLSIIRLGGVINGTRNAYATLIWFIMTFLMTAGVSLMAIFMRVIFADEIDN